MTTSQYERMMYVRLLVCDGFSGGGNFALVGSVEAAASFFALGAIFNPY